MNKEEAMAGLEAMERRERRASMSTMMITALPMMLAAGSMMGMETGTRGMHRGECGKPKNIDNRPDRAPGMKPFDIDGVIIYAGTLKAARKKAKLLAYNRSEP